MSACERDRSVCLPDSWHCSTVSSERAKTYTAALDCQEEQRVRIRRVRRKGSRPGPFRTRHGTPPEIEGVLRAPRELAGPPMRQRR